MSNLFPCLITDDNGKHYSSVEHIYATECAKYHNDANALAELENEHDQFEIHRILAKIKKQQTWKDEAVNKIRKYVEQKFAVHQHLLHQLKTTRGYIDLRSQLGPGIRMWQRVA